MRKVALTFLTASMLFTACQSKAENKENKEENKTLTESSETTKKENKMKTIQLTRAEFVKKVADFDANPTEWKYLGDKPALIDFYADWCGPCKAIAPILEELAAEYGEEIYIYKIDTEKEQELAAIFGIRSIPSLLFVPMDGKPQMATGAIPKEQLKEAINEVLLNK